jgi:hypothetical protein
MADGLCCRDLWLRRGHATLTEEAVMARLLAIVAALGGCGDGGQSGEESLRCDDFPTGPVPWGAPGPDGVRPADLAAAAVGSRTADWAWTDGGDAQVSVGIVASDGESGFIRECSAITGVEVSLTLQTDDGGLDASGPATVWVDGERRVVSFDWPTTANTGSWSPPTEDVRFLGTLGLDPFSGELALTTDGESVERSVGSWW